MPYSEVRVSDKDGYTLIEFLGEFTTENLARHAEQTDAAFVRLDPPVVLFDMTKATGAPSLEERLGLFEHGAEAIGSVARLAVVAGDHLLLPDRPGQPAAVERGVNLRIFTDYAQAEAWLLS